MGKEGGVVALAKLRGPQTECNYKLGLLGNCTVHESDL